MMRKALMRVVKDAVDTATEDTPSACCATMWQAYAAGRGIVHATADVQGRAAVNTIVLKALHTRRA
jgi:hypothetical protein